jgi:hypothetical protein
MLVKAGRLPESEPKKRHDALEALNEWFERVPDEIQQLTSP